MENKLELNSGIQVLKTDVVDQFSDKFVEDCYIDAYSEFAKGKSFCIECDVVVKPRSYFQIAQGKIKRQIGFQCVVRIFDTPRQMLNFINEFGSEKLTEVFYSAI